MRAGKTVIVSALAFVLRLSFRPTGPSAESRTDPRAAHRSLSNDPAGRSARPRAPRVSCAAANRNVTGERSRAPTRRQAAVGVAAAAAAAMAAFWPTAAPDAFEDMLGYAFWPREYGRQFWSHGPSDIMRAMTAPTAAFASQADSDLRDGVCAALVSSANAAPPIAPFASRG